MPPTKTPQQYLDQARGFIRDYTSGLNVQEVRRMFDQEATAAYRVLARDQKDADSEDDVTRFLQRVRVVFLGISARLSPTRRALFTLSIVALLWASITTLGLRIRTFVPVDFLVNQPALWYLLGAAGLLFLLTVELVDRVRVRDELEVARELQRDLLPRRAPRLADYSFAHSYRTANEVGGDYYDFIALADGRFALVVGDASGHGIAAGLLMAIANATLKTAIEIDPAPLEVTRLLNATLCRTGDRRAFMTLFYAVLDPEKGELEYVCAGHPFPLVRRVGGAVEELGEGALPLGMRTEPSLPHGRVTLDRGDLLVLFTDGLAEATDPGGKHSFGFERLRELTAAGGPAGEIHQRILEAFDAHVGEGPLTDDLTLVIVGRDRPIPPPPS